MNNVRVLVVGGLTRLLHRYREAPAGIDIDATDVDMKSLDSHAAHADAFVLVTTHVSHPAAAKVREAARARGLPLVQIQSASLSRVRQSIVEAAAAAAARRATAA